jgi:hypothetical protein
MTVSPPSTQAPPGPDPVPADNGRRRASRGAGPGDPSGGRRARPRRYRRRAALTGGTVVVVVALAAAGAAAAGIGPLHRQPAATGESTIDSPAATALAAVTRRTLRERTEETATLGYSGSYSLVNQTGGTFTALPAVGQVIVPGKVIYRVNGAPVVLLRGPVPAYRPLAKGLTGADVRQLNANLVALGLATRSQLDPTSAKFSSATVTAVKKLQDALDVDQTGSVPLGQVVFLPAAARVTTLSATLGTPAMPGSVVLAATSTGRVASIELDAADQSEFSKGAKVTITMADGRTTPGVVASVSPVATKPASDGGNGNGSGDTTPKVTVAITPTRPAETGTQDQATVTVSLTTQSVANVLTVPVNALLALAGGGYAVEVDAAGARHLVPVTLGLFDDAAGLVQVSGAGLAAGQHVVVPAS